MSPTCAAEALNETAQALYCSTSSSDCSASAQCLGICSDPDVSGFGVRYGFYLQAITNVLSVVFSESAKDSAQGAWSGSVLTAALVVPALVQKYNNSITLYDAILVLNFATLSCVSSLAVAPMCQLWQNDASQQPRTFSLGVSEGEQDASHRVTHVASEGNIGGALGFDPNGNTLSMGVNRGAFLRSPEQSPELRHPALPESAATAPDATAGDLDRTRPVFSQRRSTEEERVERIRNETIAALVEAPPAVHTGTSRLILSISLLMQITLQWTWAITLFVSHKYQQPKCSAHTVLMLFLIPMKASDIRGSLSNIDGDSVRSRWGYAVWPLWLIFTLAISTGYGFLLVLRATEFSDDERGLITPSTIASLSRAGTLGLNQSRSVSRTNTSKQQRGKRTKWTLFDTSRGRPRRSGRWQNIAHSVKLGGNLLAQRLQLLVRVLRTVAAFLLPPGVIKDESTRLTVTNKETYHARLRIWLGNALAVFFVLLFVASVEAQISLNCVLSNNEWSFGQTAALLLALAPGWALVDAIAASRKRRSIRRKRKEETKRRRRGRSAEAERLASRPRSPALPDAQNETQTPGASASVPRRRGAHARESSSSGLLSTPASPGRSGLNSPWRSSNSSITPPPNALMLSDDSPSPRALGLPPPDSLYEADQGASGTISTTLEDGAHTQARRASTSNREAVAESWNPSGNGSDVRIPTDEP